MAILSQQNLATLKINLEAISEELELKLSIKDNKVILLENDFKDSIDAANESVSASYRNRMRNREFLYFKKVRNALTKINNRTYGKCDDCDADIAFARLLARPTTEFCVVCKEEAEGIENQNVHELVPKSLGRTITER